jgi:uncharacterized protein (DUF305 family)
MKGFTWAALIVLSIACPGASPASPYESDEEEEGHYTSPSYRYFETRAAAEAAMQRDIRFTNEMGDHHQGAVDMSRAYLDDPRGTNPFLENMARAIIYNQQFEIVWLHDVRQRVSAGPQPVLQIGGLETVQLQDGLTGLEHRARFQKAPILTIRDMIRGKPPSDYDVMFAKAMKMHHQMGVDMAREYNHDPNGGNRVIREINRGIIRDQLVEIGILSEFISRYQGDPAAVEIEPQMQDMMKMQQDEKAHH